MRYGRLDRRIIIQRRTVTITASGQENETWATLATVWASVGPVRGEERFTAPQIEAKEQVEIQVRYSSAVAGVHPGDRVVFPSSSGAPTAVYDILAVHEIGRREGVKMIAERRPVPVPTLETAVPTLEDILATNPFMLALPHPGWMWQDADGLLPVTEDGQLVRRVIEQGAHKFVGLAPSDATRPTYRTEGVHHWLDLNGEDDQLVFTTNAGLYVAGSCAVVVGFRGDASQNDRRLITEMAPGGGSAEYIPIRALLGDAGAAIRNSAGVFIASSVLASGAFNGADRVFSFVDDGAFLRGNLDGIEQTPVAYVRDGDLSSVTTHRIGGRAPAGGHFVGRYYGHVVSAGTIPSDSVLSKARAYIASLMPDGPEL